MNWVRQFLAIGIVAALVPCMQGGERGKQPSGERTPEQLRVAVQEVCPVSGNRLGTHGDPIKVKVGQEEVFLCCKGCLGQKITPKLWKKIHINFAKSQRICPVMKQPLPKKAKWTIVDGRVVFVCCPPCIDKVEQEPSKFLAVVNQEYAKSLKRKTVENPRR